MEKLKDREAPGTSQRPCQPSPYKGDTHCGCRAHEKKVELCLSSPSCSRHGCAPSVPLVRDEQESHHTSTCLAHLGQCGLKLMAETLRPCRVDMILCSFLELCPNMTIILQ